MKIAMSAGIDMTRLSKAQNEEDRDLMESYQLISDDQDICLYPISKLRDSMKSD
jgi:hypothetical protein